MERARTDRVRAGPRDAETASRASPLRRRAVLAGALAACAALAFAAAPAARRPPDVVRGEPRRFLVHFEDVVRNEGDAPLRDVVCEALLPLETARQDVRWLRLSPHGWTVRRDAHGQTVATARVPAIAPGDAVCFSWIASVDLASEEHAPRPEAAAPRPEAAAPPPADVRRYLADGPRFGVTSDVVRATADEARRRAAGGPPVALAEAAAQVVRERVAFEIAGGWDPAPTVLDRGTGSCSESTFALVAVCRNLGLPARWTGGTMLRSGPAGRACDDTFHRVAEVWLPGHGWWPVETQRGPDPAPEGEDRGADARDAPEAGPDRRAAAAPSLRRAFLLLGRGDGSGDATTGVAYHARDRWARIPGGDGPRPRPAVSRRAWWLAGRPDDRAHADAGGGPLRFADAEILACDARGFGAPSDASGRAVAADPPGERPDPAEAAEILLRLAHPEGLRLAAEAHRADADSLRAVAGAYCDEVLAEEFLAACGGSPAAFEAWWAAVGPRIVPAARARLALGPTRGR